MRSAPTGADRTVLTCRWRYTGPMDRRWLPLVCVAMMGCTTAPADGATPLTTVSSVAVVPNALVPNAVVEHVVDGDTIDVQIAGRVERVRLLGIDTPETARPDQSGECFGEEAAAAMRELLAPGTAVRLERDVVGRDDYGRLLAYVYRASDGLWVNAELVRRGFARVLTFTPNTVHADDFVRAAIDAHADAVGLWSACTP
jgi:micrococcal nuclease